MFTSGRRIQIALAIAAATLAANFTASIARAEEDAVFVFKQIAPRIVALKNAEGSGTGVIVSTDGLILTNAHVVTSPLPFTVTVDQPGKPDPAVYKKVEVVSMHPDLDLALVRIDPKENRLALQPVDVAKNKGEAGQRVYIIGNPAAGGKVMTKSITSGMLSAVDREVDGQKYYQTDAAINPGNSGGPMCDRVGKVLGIVTFKFTDADAMGFAIPLDKIDFKAFVSLADHKSDAKRAADYVKRGQKYADLAVKAYKVNGPDSVERAYYNGAAAYCFRLALAEDPGNAGLYYNIGMLLRSIEEDEVGRGYLMRAIQLDPWGNQLGDSYRELGLTYAKEEKETDALCIWQEGVAKFPLAGKIWEDMAVCHLIRKEFADAAYCARVALTARDPAMRKEVLEQLERDARSKLDAGARATLDSKVAPMKIMATLKDSIAISNQARNAKKLYVTNQFAAFVEKNGSPPIKGVAEKIPQTPLELPKEMIIDAAKTPASTKKGS